MPSRIERRRGRRRLTWVLAATALMAAMSGCGHVNVADPAPARPAPAAPAGPATGSPDTTVTPPNTTVAPPTTATTTPRPTTTTPRPTTTSTQPPAASPTVPTTPATPAAPAAVPVADVNVAALQQQLTALGYWVGPIDGVNGFTTAQAVTALQKAAGLPRTGVFSADAAAALAAGTRPTPQSTTGHVIEVDLAHQLLLIVTNGHVDAVVNTSTGGGYKYYDQGTTHVAITPTGHFTTNWEVNGRRVSSLGVLWRPKFFVGGIAIHGDDSVPARPVSHGCVRVSNQAIDWIWATGTDPIGTPVWVY